MPNSSNSSGHLIGVDVGGTKILGLVVDPADWSVIDTVKQPTPAGDAGRLSSAIGDVVDDLVTRHGRPRAIGVGVPGLVDHNGVLHFGPNVPGVLSLDVAGDLTQRLDLDVAVANDGTNAALAEHRLGAAVGHDHAVVIAQGTGIAGGLIIGGQVVTGANGFAGEPGHMAVTAAPNGSERGYECACGRRGCWEAVSSGAGLANLARSLVEQGRGKTLVELAGGEVDHLRGEHVAEAMNLGDPDATEVFEQFATWVARGLANLVSLLDPSVIVLGGGLADVSHYFIEAVQDRYAGFTIGAGHRPVVPVVAAKLGSEAGAIGAALAAHDRFSAP